MRSHPLPPQLCWWSITPSAVERAVWFMRLWGGGAHACSWIEYVVLFCLLYRVNTGLQSLSRELLGVEMDKAFHVQCGNWEADQLNERQVRYSTVRKEGASVRIIVKSIIHSCYCGWTVFGVLKYDEFRSGLRQVFILSWLSIAERWMSSGVQFYIIYVQSHLMLTTHPLGRWTMQQLMLLLPYISYGH